MTLGSGIAIAAIWIATAWATRYESSLEAGWLMAATALTLIIMAQAVARYAS